MISCHMTLEEWAFKKRAGKAAGELPPSGLAFQREERPDLAETHSRKQEDRNEMAKRSIAVTMF